MNMLISCAVLWVFVLSVSAQVVRDPFEPACISEMSPSSHMRVVASMRVHNKQAAVVVVGGKTRILRVGDKYGDDVVAAIDARAITLVPRNTTRVCLDDTNKDE